MTRQERIHKRLNDGLAPAHLTVIDESSQHNVPAGSETHFNVVVVSEGFDDMRHVQRHRRVHDLLREELDDGLHALTLTLWTPPEYAERGKDATLASPSCMGGGRKAV